MEQTGLAVSHGVQAPVAAFGVTVAALLVQRDSLSFTGGWRIRFGHGC